jgi:hypothetical protein
MLTANAALALVSALSLLFTYAMILLYKRAVERRDRYRFACDAAREKLIQVALPLALWLSKRVIVGRRDIDMLWAVGAGGGSERVRLAALARVVAGPDDALGASTLLHHRQLAYVPVADGELARLVARERRRITCIKTLSMVCLWSTNGLAMGQAIVRTKAVPRENSPSLRLFTATEASAPPICGCISAL